MQQDISPDDAVVPECPSYIARTLSQSGLLLRRAPGKRFGVFAAKAFAAGSCIMTEDAVACCVARSVAKRSTGKESGIAPVACASCMCDDKPLMKCVACGVAHYCCKEHQLAHWPKHKAMCARFKKMPKELLQQPVWRKHFSIMSLCTELHDATGTKTTHASSSATTPGPSDVMFLCSGQASPAAAEVALALRHVMGVGEPACE